MAKIPLKLEVIRNELVYNLWKNQADNFLTAEDIGKIFGMSTMSVYNIVKEMSPNRKPTKKLIN